MRRSNAVLAGLAVLVAVLGLLWLASGGDWFGLLGERARTTETADAPEEVGGTARLEGRGRVLPDKDPATFDGDPVGVLDLGLGNAALSGTVTGAGAPLRFARVVAVLAPPNDGRGVRTTKDGRFEIRGLPPAPTDVRASAEGFTSRTLSLVALVDGRTTDVGAIDLKRRPAQDDGLEVKVTDAGGRPIAGAKVSATTMPYGIYLTVGAQMAGIVGATSKDAHTDDLGTARFHPLPPERYDVVVRATGYALDALPSVVVAAGRVERVHVTLRPGLTMSGVVVDLAGAPVEGAHVGGVQMGAWRNPEAVLTDASGAFTLEGLIPGPYMLFAGHETKGEGSDQTHKAGDKGLKIQLKGIGTLAGRVVTEDGKPVPKFTLRPYDNRPFLYAYSVVHAFEDPEGRFRIERAPGTYTIEAKADGCAFSSTTTAQVDLDKTREIVITLAAEGCVRGVVTDPDGNHLEGAEVYLRHGGFPPSPVREQYARTDADGRFALNGMALESVRLYARHAAYAVRVFEATPAPPAAAKELTVRLTRGARVEGKVLSKASGAPLEGEEVSLVQGWEVFDAKTTVTDATGTYAFPSVAEGVYNLTAGRTAAGTAAQTKNGVRVPAEGTLVVNFESQKDAEASGSVGGRVTMAGAPLAGAEVSAYDDRGWENAVTEKTDADGRYLAKGLKPGRVTVRVEAPGGAADTDRVTIPKAGDVATLDFEFGRCALAGTLVSVDGRTSVSGAWITVESADGASGGDAWAVVKAQLMSDAAGRFSAKGLAAGAYRVRIVANGHAAKTTEAVALGEGESKDLGAIRLAAGGSIAGRVTDDRGVPVEHVALSLRDARGQSVFLFNMASTGSDGRYSMQGLELGAYTVRFEGKGFAPLEKPAVVSSEGSVLDAVLPRGGSLAAVVEDDRGNPVEGARVELYDARGERVAKTLSIVNLFDGDASKTNASGAATIPDLAPGAYVVKATKDGYAMTSDAPTVGVSSGGTSSARLVLRTTP
jgi:protocatechuate 3,4-dioxygenase beta subunit